MAESATTRELDRLVRQRLPDAMRLAVRLTGDVHEAEEVVQDALLRVARNWRSFREESSFWTWFVRILLNVFRDRLAAAGRHAVVRSYSQRSHSTADSRPTHRENGCHKDRSDEPSDPAAGPTQRILHGELGELIAARVSALPPRQREVMTLIAFEDFTPAQAAEVLETTENNIYATLHTARNRLRRELAPYLNDS